MDVVHICCSNIEIFQITIDSTLRSYITFAPVNNAQRLWN